jgi:hypothetical protein
MNKRHVETYKMLTRVVDLITRNVSWFPNNSAAAEILKTLGVGVEKLSGAFAARSSAESALRETHDARTTARSNARDLISRASMVSRASHNSKVRIPKTGSEQALIAIGRGIEKDAASLKEDFVRHALSLDEVIAATRALETAVLDNTKAKTARSAALAEWDKAMAEALDALIGLDALVANALAHDPVALASYQGVRSIARTRGRTVAKAPPEEVPAPPVAAANSAAA